MRQSQRFGNVAGIGQASQHLPHHRDAWRVFPVLVSVDSINGVFLSYSGGGDWVGNESGVCLSWR